ncbi:MAG: xanthine dehydrogenase family protein subunit M [Acidobacteria bacterium]|nr:xanthine dehydrogenase family protein subunit M [Acidobacteriota bacterium]
MYPAEFRYHRASSVEEALDLLDRNPGAKFLAGGHSLIPMMKLRLAQPEVLIDIGRLDELAGVSANGDSLSIGSLTTHSEIASSPELRKHCPILAEAASKIADPQVRNKGTIGGNLAHADPASDLPAVLVALGATIQLRSRDGARAVPASDFFVELLTTSLAENEIMTAVEVPKLGAGTGSTYLKVEHPASGYAVCGAAAVVTVEGGTWTSASLAFNGVTATPLAALEVVEALIGSDATDQAIDRAVESRLSVPDPMSDLYASGEYRAALAAAYGKRALKSARDRAG